MILEPTEYINGLLSLIAVITSLLFGLLICSRYFKTKNKEFLFIGISTFGIYQPWWPNAVGFLLYLFTGRLLDPVVSLFIANFFIPIFITLWMLAMNEMLFEGKRIIIPIIYFIVTILMDIYLVFFLIVDPNVIGIITGPFDTEYGRVMSIYLLFILTSIVVTSIIFSVKSMRLDDPEIKLKGEFLIVGFSLYLCSGVMDVGIIHLTTITLIIARSMLILSSIFIYIGFLLPNYVKKILLKEH